MAKTRLLPKSGTLTPLPVEIEIFLDRDGSVTFADLDAGMLAVASHLNPEQSIACDVPRPAMVLLRE